MQQVEAQIPADRAVAQARPVDRDQPLSVVGAAEEILWRGIAVLGDLGKLVEEVGEAAAPLPQGVGDVRGSRTHQGRPAAVVLHPGHPVAELVARQPPRLAEVRTGEATHRERREEPRVGGVLDPVGRQRDALVVLGGARARADHAGGVVDQARGGDVGRPPPVGEMSPAAQLGRIVRPGLTEPLDHDRLLAHGGAPDPQRGGSGASGKDEPPWVGLPHTNDGIPVSRDIVAIDVRD